MKIFSSTLLVLMTLNISNVTIFWIVNAQENSKVTICHKGKNLEISEKALQSHLDLGDTLGECDSSNSNWQVWEDEKGKYVWVDQEWRERKYRHQDAISGKNITLYKKYIDIKYDLNNVHEWCVKIEEIYNKKLSKKKEVLEKGFLKKLENCRKYFVPYNPKNSQETGLSSNWTFQINNWDQYTESQSVSINFFIDWNLPDFIRYSEDGQNFWEWLKYEGSTRDYLFKDNSAWNKKLYIEYKNWNTISTDFSEIKLLPKYGAEYQIISNWVAKGQNYESGKSYNFFILAKNKGFLNWEKDGNTPVQLTYKLLKEDGEVIKESKNRWVLPWDIDYWRSVNISTLVRIPDNIDWKIKVVFDLEYGNTKFSEVWVDPISTEIIVNNIKPLPREVLKNDNNLPFWVWEYAPLWEEKLPSNLSVCETSANIYELSEWWDIFSIRYIAPYTTVIDRIYDLWLDKADNTAFYEISYTPDDWNLYIYKDAVNLSSTCPENENDFSNRRCEEYYTDMWQVNNEDCWTIFTTSSKNIFTWYKDWTFWWDGYINKSELSKTLIWASSTPIMPYRNEIPDVSPESWYAEYAQATLDAGIFSLDSDGNFNPLQNMTFKQALQSLMDIFKFSTNNTCNYDVIFPDDKYIWWALFYWIIKSKDEIPENPETNLVTRLEVAKMILRAYYQQNNLKTAGQICPNAVDERFTKKIKEICWIEEKVVLSTTEDLNKDGDELENGIEAEIIDDSSDTVKIRLIESWEIGYLKSSEISDICNVDTPTEELKTPEDDEVVVASLEWIYAHEKPNATSNYFDYNNDWIWNNADIVPYNEVLKVLDTEWNWFKVQFEDQRTAWIFNWFVSIWAGVQLPEIKETEMWTISWSHGVTVDLRANENTESRENIIWETYENTRVQVLEKDEERDMYYVRIDSTEKDLSEEVYNTHYARLYPNLTLWEMKFIQNGISGWVHKDFVELDWVDYESEKNLDYPFDYEAFSASGRTTDVLVNQIFLEEFNWSVHKGIDFNMLGWEKVKAVANGVVESVESNTVTVKQDDGRYSRYHHIVPSTSVWVRVDSNSVVWEVAEGTEEFKAHLHLELFEKVGNFNMFLNPAKYFKIYDSQDSHKCMRELIIDEGIYDGEEVYERCNIGIWGLCRWYNEKTSSYWSYSDVYNGTSLCEAVTKWANRNWIDIWDPLAFRPTDTISRREAIKLVFQVSGAKFTEWDTSCLGKWNFVDMSRNDWGTKYVCAWVKLGWIAKNKEFRPDDSISYQEYIKWLFWASDIGSCLTTEIDSPNFSWGYKYLAVANYFELPRRWLDNIVDRSSVMIFLYKFSEKVLDDVGNKNIFTDSECVDSDTVKAKKDIKKYLNDLYLKIYWETEDVLLEIFKESKVDMMRWYSLSPHDKFNKWKDLETWYYDLVYTTWDWFHETALTGYEHLISPEKTIEIDWKIYSLWEVSNILVWYNAYYIWYNALVLDLWAMAFTFYDTAHPIDWKHMSNGIEWEFRDSKLYEAWYKLAKDVEENWGILTEEMLVEAIETWTYNRKVMTTNDAEILNILKKTYYFYDNVWLRVFDTYGDPIVPITY